MKEARKSAETIAHYIHLASQGVLVTADVPAAVAEIEAALNDVIAIAVAEAVEKMKARKKVRTNTKIRTK